MSRGMDLHNNVRGLNALTIQTINSNTTTNGEIIDTSGFNSLEFLILPGTITDGAYAVSIQEGDESDMSDAAAIDSGNVLGDADFGLTDDDTVQKIGSVAKKRYQRLSIVSTSVSSGGNLAAIAVLNDPLRGPVS